MTLRLYATHKDIPLRGVDVTLEFDRVHADDGVDCDERADGVIERVESRITIYGELTAAERARLTLVAERCPVHKTLANGVQIADTVSFSATGEFSATGD